MLHLLSVADVLDPNIGKSCALDQKRTHQFFGALCGELQMPFDDRLLKDDEFNAPAITMAVDNLSPSPQDIVIFYYSGHGLRGESKTDPWPVLQLGTNPDTAAVRVVDLATIYETLVKQRPRLLLMMVDCCNVIRPDSAIEHAVKRKEATLEDLRHETNLKRLFQQFSGQILCMGAQPGEVAMGGPKGGVFSYQMLSAIIDEVSQNEQATWQNIMAKAGQAIDFEALLEQGLEFHTSLGMSMTLHLANESNQQVPVWKVIAHEAHTTEQERMGGLEPLPGQWQYESTTTPSSNPVEQHKSFPANETSGSTASRSVAGSSNFGRSDAANARADTRDQRAAERAAAREERERQRQERRNR
jgi:hypothetical protein